MLGRKMKVRKHFFVGDNCIHCGALYFPKLQKLYSDRGEAVPQNDERTCVERDDHFYPHELRPEPAARQVACEDADTIKAAIDALRATQKEQQPAAEQQSSDWGCYFEEALSVWRIAHDEYQERKLLHLSEKSIG